jgi:hypothetical protein
VDPWAGAVENTYDRYLKMFHDEGSFCNAVTHVVAFEEQPWEWCRQGRLKWFTHPEMEARPEESGCTCEISREVAPASIDI